jgi:hypothetical protein
MSVDSDNEIILSFFYAFLNILFKLLDLHGIYALGPTSKILVSRTGTPLPHLFDFLFHLLDGQVLDLEDGPDKEAHHDEENDHGSRVHKSDENSLSEDPGEDKEGDRGVQEGQEEHCQEQLAADEATLFPQEL